MNHSQKHFIVVIGGSVAGSEAAYQLAQRDFRVIVFDQSTLPYGKIEDGLPLWHVKLRDKEERIIDEKLSHKNIWYVPEVKLGKDVNIEDVARNWGVSAVLIATGAWKDRELPISNEQDFINKGLIYQNPFMYWFNHKHEPGYSGPVFKVKDETLVIGGGLASFDVIKACMIELVQQALQKLGISLTLFDLEHNIKRVLDSYDLTLQDLGIKGCTLVYRRYAKDMPLSDRQRNSPEEKSKAEQISQKILNNFTSKFLFKFEELLSPIKGIADTAGNLSAMVFQKMSVENGKPEARKTKTLKCSQAISSIGSLPEIFEGIPFDGSVYKISDPTTSRIEGFENVFAIGNAVTGRGNIRESVKHGKETTLNIVDDYLAIEADNFSNNLRNQENNISFSTNCISKLVQNKSFQDDAVIQSILQKISDMQRKNGSDVNYWDWIAAHKPVRLEELIGK